MAWPTVTHSSEGLEKAHGVLLCCHGGLDGGGSEGIYWGVRPRYSGAFEDVPERAIGARATSVTLDA